MFMHDRQQTLTTLDLFRGLVIRFMMKLKVRLTLYFSESDLAGMIYLSHSSSGILQKLICIHSWLIEFKEEQNTAYAFIHIYLYMFYTYIYIYRFV